MARAPLPNAPGLDSLIEALRALPGVGPRSAQRMAYHLLQHERSRAAQLARALAGALASVRHCSRCNNFTEAELCTRCRSSGGITAFSKMNKTPADFCIAE